jgi:hypothetical protein
LKPATAGAGLGAIRVVVGAAALVAPTVSRRLLRLPAQHDNPSARLMVALFAWREMALGAQVLLARNDTATLHRLAGLNALVDFGDAVTNAVPLVRRQGIDAGATSMFVTALVGAGAWSWLRRLAAAEMR